MQLKTLLFLAAISFSAFAADLVIDVPAALPDKCNAVAPETISSGVQYLDMTSAWDNIEHGYISLHSIGFREVLAYPMQVTIVKRVPKVKCLALAKVKLWGANHDDILLIGDPLTINGTAVGNVASGMSGIVTVQ